MGQPATLVVLFGAAAVLALAGPFGTDDLLGLGPRFAYWLAICFPTYAAGVIIAVLMDRRRADRPKPLPEAAFVALQAIATGVAVSALVLAVNFVAFGWWPDSSEAPVFFATIFAISLIVTVVLHVARSPGAKAGPVAPAVPAPPSILDRLPFDKRGTLLALSVEDHYVRVRTAAGSEMLLMRLTDAIREVGDTPGAQVHRSHWVSFDAITSAQRAGDRAILTLRDGSEVPVSRANVAKIREAGFLPR